MQNITVINYQPEHQPHFERLNKQWIEKYFQVEPVDEFVLTQPEKAILEPGGAILVALLNKQVAGVVALRKAGDLTYEFTKMAVDENFRRRGVAEALSHAAIEKAMELHATSIILYSQTILQPAISLYRKLGFKEVPLVPGHVYKRSDIKMELLLETAIS
ncbi:MAG: GNAT family N-acetyltransferase [Chitinophagaceae bacterium]